MNKSPKHVISTREFLQEFFWDNKGEMGVEKSTSSSMYEIKKCGLCAYNIGCKPICKIFLGQPCVLEP
jgi:hypothetical protein